MEDSSRYDLRHLPTDVAQLLHSLSDTVGLPEDQLLLVSCLLASYPLGIVHRLLRSPTARHVFSIVVGITFIYALVGGQVFHALFSTTIAYFLLKYFPNNPSIVYIFAMGYNCGGHLYQMVYDYLGWHMDFRNTQMLLTAKFIMLAFNRKDHIALKKGEQLHPKPHIHAFRRDRACEFPSILEYYSYMLFYGGIMVGPAIELNYYLAFTNGDLAKKAGKQEIPFWAGFERSMRALAKALFCTFVVLQGARFPASFVSTDAFLQSAFLYKVFYVTITNVVYRYLFYTAWYFAEGGVNMHGLGFDMVVPRTKKGETPRPAQETWDRTAMCRFSGIETAYTCGGITDNWNMPISEWVKNYVFNRLSLPNILVGVIDSRSFRLIAARVHVAVFHGFYPTYYMYFLSGFLLNFIESSARAAFPKKVPSFAEKVFMWFLLHVCFAYFTLAFLLIDIEVTWRAYKSVYFYGHVICLVTIALFLVFAPKKRRKPVAVETVSASAVVQENNVHTKKSE